jgi:DNA helicase-2/ATP-dependent DNA helicase PcrA
MNQRDALSLNEAQQEAVCAKAQHILVLAGAGTGKTTTIVGRCKFLLNEGVPESSILLATFTRKASEQIRAKLIGPDNQHPDINVSTFHAWAMRIIRLNPKLFDLKSPTLIDRDDAKTIFRGFIKGTHPGEGIKPSDLADFYSLVVNIRGNPEDAARLLKIDDSDLDLYVQASVYYREYKKTKNYMDYDDVLECLADRLLDKRFAKAIAERWRHFLIDEMQDTNPLQYAIIDAIAPHANIFCVGDDAQSIYGFRGADFESIHAFKKRYKNAHVLKLRENYRSTQEILDLSNWLLSQSELKYDKELIAARGSGSIPILFDAENKWEEADFVVRKIVEAYETEERWSNNMVLARYVYSIRAIESKLLQHKIPYRLTGGGSLLTARHVKDVMSLVRIYANRKDELAWLRYLQLWKGLGEVTAGKIISTLFALDGQQNAANQNDLEVITRKMESSDVFGWTQPLLCVLKSESSPEKLIEVAYSVLEPTLEKIYHSDNWDSRRRDFDFVKALATKFSDVSAFVDEYLLNPIYERNMGAGDKDKVDLITVHSAKGLEASRCFVIDVSPGEYPRSGEDSKQCEEERRVLYVGLTRAANELYITRSKRGWGLSKRNEEDLYFLDGVPENLLAYDFYSGDDDPESSYRIVF